ncbi:MAG: outer membrane beta-barrel protein [Gallionellaceae bacterium]|jgi:opacity protein-like surface antigen
MKKLLLAMTMSVALLAIPLSAQAYVGAGVGLATTDTENTSYKVFLGIQILPVLGVELAYNNFGGFRGKDADAVSLAAVATLPLSDTIDVFGKLGSTENYTKFGGSASNRALLTGFGVAFNAASGVSVRIEYENFGRLLEESRGIDTIATNWGVNLRSSF